MKRAVMPNSFDLIDTGNFAEKDRAHGQPEGHRYQRSGTPTRSHARSPPAAGWQGRMWRPGTAPKKVIYLEGERSRSSATAPTQFMSPITVYNADTLHPPRPDQAPSNSWAELQR